MAPVRVIQDSDDESDPISPERPQVNTDEPTTSELLRGTPQTAELSGGAPEASMSSNGINALRHSVETDVYEHIEPLLHDDQSVQRHLPEPTPQHLSAPTLEWNTSAFTTIAQVNRRQTTMGIMESQKEDFSKLKRGNTVQKTYGSNKRQQRSSSFFDEEVDGTTGFDFFDEGPSTKRQRVDGKEAEYLHELGAHATEEDKNPFGADAGAQNGDVERHVPADIDIGNFFKQYSSKSSSDVTHLTVASDYAITGEMVSQALPAEVVENDMLYNGNFHEDVTLAGDRQGLRASSFDPMLGPHSSIPDYKNQDSHLEVAPPTLTDSQKEQYDNIGSLVLQPDLDSTPDAGELLLDLWGKTPDGHSTIPIASDERYDSQLAKAHNMMDGPSDPVAKGSSLQSGHSPGARTSGRSKSFIEITSSSATRASSPAEKSKSNRRTKTSHNKNESQNPPSSIDNLVLPPAVKEKVEKRSAKASRKPRIQTDDEADELASDEAMIGLPREQYKARPSRSRSGTHDDFTEQPPSPQKKRSGPDSDELAIGLPKEQYKPRPSRSRGGNTAEVVEALDFTKPKKKKLKRGITTGHILKKKIVDTDDEDDVIYVDERPKKGAEKKAKDERVKDEGPDEVSKWEETSPIKADEHPDVEKDGPIFEDDEIASDEAPAPKPAPKKRGRKPKPTAVPAPEPEDTHDPAEELPSEEFLVDPLEAKRPEPKKRGRKPRVIRESIFEVEDNPDPVPATEELGDTVETPELNDAGPEPEPEPEPAGPKKRGRKRKATAEVPIPVEEPVPEATADPEDEEAPHAPIPDPLKEKAANLKGRIYPPSSTSKSKGKSVALGTEDSTYADDENQDASNSQDLASPPETPRKVAEKELEKEEGRKEEGREKEKDAKGKGPTRHSPIGKNKVPLRVGLSRRARIEPLLKIRGK